MSIAPAGEPYAAPAATAHRYRSICTLLYCPPPPVVLPVSKGSTTGRTTIRLVEKGRSRASAPAATKAVDIATAATPMITDLRAMATPYVPGRARLPATAGHLSRIVRPQPAGGQSPNSVTHGRPSRA
jgi:hypothetical protein